MPKDLQITDDRRVIVCLYDIDVDDLPLSVYEFRAYMRIVRRAAGGRSDCKESVENMAEACGMSRPSMVRSIKSLIDYGMIRRTSKAGDTSTYSLQDKAEWKIAGKSRNRVAGKPQNHPLANERTTLGKSQNQHLVNHRTTKNTIEEYKEEKGEPAPDRVTISDALEDIYPGHATDIRLMNQLRDLVKRVNATPDHILAFPAWLSERYPTKANGPFAFKDLFAEYVKSSPTGNGNGEAKLAADRCPNCNGAGKSVRRGPDRFKPGQLLETCPICNGAGTTTTGAHHVSNRTRNRITA